MTETGPSKETLDVTREAILSGAVLRAAAQTPGHTAVLSEADLAASIAAILGARPEQREVWVFGYGSLIWNPAFRYDQQRVGHVRGWHRRFCLWTSLSRGSPDLPGLILGLDLGGACGGIVYRIPAEEAALELAVLWRREMADGAYTPRWVGVETDQGRLAAVTFTINRAHSRYAGKLDQARVASVIARAAGMMGRCSDYLDSTVTSLEAHGIRDRKLRALNRRVQALVAQPALDGAAPRASP
jgi:cation transport protein ChaC